MAIKAYGSALMGVPGKTLGTMFTPLTLEMTSYEPEAVGASVCQKSKAFPKHSIEMKADLEHVTMMSKRVIDMLEAVISYVDDVLTGRIAADNMIGRLLMDLVHSVPQMDPQQFDSMINSNMKDLLMVVYLSQLTKSQLAINEKLVQI